MKKLVLLSGAAVCGIIGYIVFLGSGLCSACGSQGVQYAVGFAVIFGYISIFRKVAHRHNAESSK